MSLSASLLRFLFIPIHDVNRYKTIISIIFYLVAGATMLRYAMVIINGGNDYVTGDWLINLQGGLIRRGLVGEILYQLATSLHLNILYLCFLLQCSIYALCIHFLLNLFFSSHRTLNHLALICSPAFIVLFNLYDFYGSFRKEIIALLAFLLIINGVLQTQKKLVFIGYITYFFAVLAHEANAFIAPFILLFLLFNKDYIHDQRVFVKHVLAVLVTSVSGIIFALIFSGRAGIDQAICLSLTDLGLDRETICTGAIHYLTLDSSDGWELVSNYISRYQYWESYGFATLLALLPFLLLPQVKRNLLTLFIGFISFIPIFALGVDWGRWLSIIITFSSLIALTNRAQTQENPCITITPFVFFLFVFCWRIRHCCEWEMNNIVKAYSIFQSIF